MNIVYFDTFSGISGDMTLGAFLSAGLSIDDLTAEISKLNLEGVELQARHLQRHGIVAVKLDVVISAPQHHHRHVKDIVGIIDRSSLSLQVKENAKKIFMEVAKAESKVHNVPMEKVHFHEVGALDSIVDIVGAAICFEKMNIGGIYSSPICLGNGGFVNTEHGKLPLPGPATLEILKDYPTVLTDIPFELTTPTGAAIIRAMSSGVISSEKIVVHSVGYGAGDREIPGHPNLLRVMIGEFVPEFTEDEVEIVEANIDDMNPEIYPFVIEQLLQHGALDAYVIPIQMKKGRPGTLLSAIVEKAKRDDVVKIFLSQTTTIGVRIFPASRKKAGRDVIQVLTSFGSVKVKKITFNGVERHMPEFEECKRIALEKGIPLVEVYKVIEAETINRSK